MDQMISQCGMRSKGSIKTGNEKGEFQSQRRTDKYTPAETRDERRK